MALFRALRGDRAALDAQPLHDGYAYFCTDGTFHIDYLDNEGNLQRKQINAKDAETLGLRTADEFVLKTELLQANWAQTDPTQPDYIKNKPKQGAVFSASISNNTFILEETGIYVASVTDNILIIE